MHNAQLKNWLNLFARIKGNAIRHLFVMLSIKKYKKTDNYVVLSECLCTFVLKTS